MSTNTSSQKIKNKFSNTVYLNIKPRTKLEELTTEVGYKRGKVMSASAFVRYLIENYGDDAKNKILSNG